MSIYVEIPVRAAMETLWERTQDPGLHERWDLRFSTIEYLPRDGDDAPQRFRYTTRIGLGFAISGTGETVGQRDLPDGSRTSALRFGSDSSLSLIREGSGYWKYAPESDGVRFITAYDYRTRFGRLGAIVDRLAFRPLMGWATAWSFDRLRLWLEEGVPPAVSLRAASVHGLARLALALTLAWHGLVPKLIGRDADEMAMLTNAGLAPEFVDAGLILLGVVEVALAVCLLAFWHRRWPIVAVAAFAILALVAVAATSPGYLGGAFGPVTLTLAILALAGVDLLALPLAPNAGRCRRRPAEATT